MNIQELKELLVEAQNKATAASMTEYNKYGTDMIGACGFAWVNIYQFNNKKLDGRTKMGRTLKAAGVRKDWQGNFQVWCNWYGGQNIDIKEAGAREFARVLTDAGFTAYAGSRLD